MLAIDYKLYSESFVRQAVEAALAQGLLDKAPLAGGKSLAKFAISVQTPKGEMYANTSYEDDEYPGIIVDIVPGDNIIGLVRHTSSTYKLRVSNGDVKNVMLETGHASSDILLETYSKAFSEDRQEYAQLFDQAFFGSDEIAEIRAIERMAECTDKVVLSSTEMASILAVLRNNPHIKEQLLSFA